MVYLIYFIGHRIGETWSFLDISTNLATFVSTFIWTHNLFSGGQLSPYQVLPKLIWRNVAKRPGAKTFLVYIIDPYIIYADIYLIVVQLISV